MKPLLQVVFTGTLYSGKTTLAREVAQRLSLEAVLDFKPEYGPPGTRGFCDLMDEELESALRRVCVVDRYWTDRLSFEHLFDHHPECVARLVPKMQEPIPAWRHIFFVEPEIDYQKDVERPDRDIYADKRLELSFNIARLLSIFDIPHTVLTGVLEQRVVKVLNILELEGGAYASY